jgi:rhodanese-related sulfurtransferase
MSCLCDHLIANVEQNDAVLISKIKAGTILIDARSKASYHNAHVPGAVSIPAGDRSGIHIDANVMVVEGNLRSQYYDSKRENSMIVYDEIGSDSVYVIKVVQLKNNLSWFSFIYLFIFLK